MKRSVFLISMVCVLIITIYGEESVVIKRENTHFRQGPGSYYPLIGMLPKGVRVAVMETQSGWMKVQCADQIGWISENAIIASAEPTGTILTGSISGSGSMIISKASASGAVKGFAQKFVNYHDGDPAFIEQYDVAIFTPAEFQRFKQETFRGRDPEKIRKRYKRIKAENTDHSISLQAEKIGLAAASKIAASGLVMNQSQLKYINLVGNIVLENTDMYDYPFKFYILKDSRPSAYAIPNGMIFVTSGLLEMLRDEAELAAILAHEISHVVQKHGVQEIAKRKTMIAADEKFNELDEEIVTEDATADELDLIALNCYETATKRRQIEYEIEADQLGVIYAYRSGYDPAALGRVLTRIKANTSPDFWNPESNWSYDAVFDRVERINNFINKNLTKNPEWNVTNPSRFRSVFK
ncbi:MAG TPA: M48 family metalloprotease [Candidatus Marinimicrobia bacterium]|nr:M48 family metalloprotease [Candidatus Neomarinimicrobiota bacterium]HRS51184.1 M48 family metalloprotease [Candidatus Neomarinimicrobiota bacterium]